MGDRRPNVLLIVFDTARADVLEPYGAAAGSSPALAQLASSGHVAPAAAATSCWTVPSHTSLFTGLLPRTAGLGRSSDDTPQGFREVLRSHRDRMLPTVLGRNGYATAGLSANLWVSPDSGFDTGFDEFHYVRSRRTAEIGDRSWRGRAAWALEALRARADDGAGQIEQMLRDRLGARDGRPFFWFVNLVECHSPYLPPRPYNDLGPIARLKAANDAQLHQTFLAFVRASIGGFDVDDEALDRMRHLYRRSILLMDEWLARVLQALDDARVLDDTLVLVTSDHGENFGECRLMGHGFSLDDRLIRIPMVAAGPGAPALDGVTSLTDVPAMLAEVTGVADHPWEPRADPGIAVAQLDTPCTPDDEAGVTAIADLGLGADAHRVFTTPLACATNGSHKLLRRGDTEEVLFDLAADPLETAGIPSSAAPAELAPLVARLRRALDDARAAEVAPRRPAAAPAADDVEDLRARMELLGYL